METLLRVVAMLFFVGTILVLFAYAIQGGSYSPQVIAPWLAWGGWGLVAFGGLFAQRRWAALAAWFLLACTFGFALVSAPVFSAPSLRGEIIPWAVSGAVILIVFTALVVACWRDVLCPGL